MIVSRYVSTVAEIDCCEKQIGSKRYGYDCLTDHQRQIIEVDKLYKNNNDRDVANRHAKQREVV